MFVYVVFAKRNMGQNLKINKSNYLGAMNKE